METDFPYERAVEAVEKANDDEGKIVKVLFLDDHGEPVGEWASSQIPEDPFSGMSGIQEPPFSLEQLVFLAETHPVHSAALEQKTADTVGKGWEWVAVDPDQADDTQRDELSVWFESLAPGSLDVHEVVSAAWLDYETVGWGLIELVRDPQGVVRQIFHVPGHTVRAHKDGFRLAQIRGGKKIWFRRWGAPDKDGKPIAVDEKTGSLRSVNNPANDLFVINRTSRRSSWYGIPGYISAIGWITLALAARDDNLFFFANRREPRWAVILSNLSDDPNITEDLRRAFTVDLRQPHRNILVPITGKGEIKFQKLSDNRQEGSFDRLSERADKAIMIAHRVPAERLANSQVGPLGGNATVSANKIYKEGVINPAQEMLAKRLNRFLEIEFSIASGDPPTWRLEMDPLDIESDREDLDLAVRAFKADLITLREARFRIKEPPLVQADTETGAETESSFNDMLYTQLPGVSQFDDESAPSGAALARDEFTALDRSVRELLVAERDAHEQLVDLTERVLSGP